MARPLTKLLKKDAQWVWETEQDRAFCKLKDALTSRPVLALYDPKLETQVHTDASKHGISSVLLQKQSNGLFKPIADKLLLRNHTFQRMSLKLLQSLQH